MADIRRQRDLVRELARRVAEIAAEPRMAAIVRRWRDLQTVLDKVQDRYCIMWRQKASGTFRQD